jgi:hypothetical protein
VLIWGQEPGSGEPPPPPPPTTFIHVDNIDMMEAKAKGPFFRVEATVTIVDDNGENVISDATVYGTFSGTNKSNSVSGVTDTGGTVLLSSKVKGSGGTFCVDNITKGGCTYKSDYNVETCDTSNN